MKAKALIVTSSLLIAGSWSALAWREPARASQPAVQQRSPIGEVSAISPEAAVEISAPSPESQGLTGLVVPAAQVEIRAQADGVLGPWAKSVGQSVKAGEAVVALDDQDLQLESQRQKARIAAVRDRIAAGRARVEFLRAKAKRHESVYQKGALSLDDLAENRCLTEEAEQNLAATEQDLAVQEIGARAIERQLRKLCCRAPIDGEVCEVHGVAEQYVREGEIIARVRSRQLQVIVDLPAPMVEQIVHTSFSFEHGQRTVTLSVASVKASYNLDGSRAVILNVPADAADTTVVGQTLRLKASVK
jgi:multidrug efflux pump subunit AcrA (membrane-fusion protein)